MARGDQGGAETFTPGEVSSSYAFAGTSAVVFEGTDLDVSQGVTVQIGPRCGASAERSLPVHRLFRAIRIWGCPESVGSLWRFHFARSSDAFSVDSTGLSGIIRVETARALWPGWDFIGWAPPFCGEWSTRENTLPLPCGLAVCVGGGECTATRCSTAYSASDFGFLRRAIGYQLSVIHCSAISNQLSAIAISYF